MSNRAREAANQVIRYEKAQGQITSIKEGEEPLEFWDALVRGQFFADGCNKKEVKDEQESFSGSNKIATVMQDGSGEINEYDLDFELFHKALAGGVVPPFSVSNAGSETCLPARENGWSRLRRKFVNGLMKEFVASKPNCATSLVNDESNMIIDTGKESEDAVSLAGFASPASPPADVCGSPDSFDCFPNVSPNRISPQLSSKSPTLSPSTSDYSSSFTFSPSSCNWSDLSRQPSPSGLEVTDISRSLCEETAFSLSKVFSPDHTSEVVNSCFPCKGNFPSIAERRGSNPPPRLVRSAGKPSIAPRNLVRSWSFSLPDLENDEVKDMDNNQFVHEGNREELMLDADIACGGNDSHDEIKDKKECDKFHFSLGTTDKIVGLATPVLYQWPALSKVESSSFQVLDSRSVYLLLAPDMSLGTNESGILYVWLGCEVLSEKGQGQLVSNNCSSKDGHFQLETIGYNFINQMGLPMDTSVQIVREGEETEQFLDHLKTWFRNSANH